MLLYAVERVCKMLQNCSNKVNGSNGFPIGKRADCERAGKYCARRVLHPVSNGWLSRRSVDGVRVGEPAESLLKAACILLAERHLRGPVGDLLVSPFPLFLLVGVSFALSLKLNSNEKWVQIFIHLRCSLHCQKNLGRNLSYNL